MITREEYNRVGIGSVLMFPRRAKPPVFRSVIIGPADHVDPTTIHGVMLPIMRRSWTRRGYTYINLVDLNDRGAEVTNKHVREIMTKEEIFQLLNWHEHPSELIQREIREDRHSPYWNPLKNPLYLCKKLREMRNSLRWASI